MNETRQKRGHTLRALARKTIGSGTRSHRARAAMLGMALGVTATVSAAPASTDIPHHTVPTATPSKPKHHWFQTGRASWYGGNFNGKRTASGERFNQNFLTCAHRTLPLGSWIRVTNLSNNKSTFVRVTDRGPFVKNVVLDLSYAAARRLGFTSTARVRIDKVAPDDPNLDHLQNLAQLEMPPVEAMAGGQ